MKEILSELNFKANNLEEICCGIANSGVHYKTKENRDRLINEIESELEPFLSALAKLKQLNIPVNEDESNLRYKFESEKSVIYDSKTDRNICMYFDDDVRDFLLKLLNRTPQKIK